MLPVIRAVAVMTPLAVTAAPASAQLVAPRERAPIEIGSVSLYPRVRVTDSGKDSNVFREATLPKEDYTATVSSRVLGVAKIGSNELLFSTGSDYVWFQKYESERSNNGAYAARFNVNASRFQPFIGASYVVSSSRPNPEIDGRVRRIERAVQTGVAFNLAERTALVATAQLDDSTYSDGEAFRGVELAEPLNRTGRVYSGGVKYALTPLTTLSVTGEVGRDRFPESHLRDANSYSINPTLIFSPDAAIQGQFMVGFEAFRPTAPTLPDRKGAVFSGALTWTMFERTTFGVQASRNVGYSYLDNEQYYLWTTVHLDFMQPIFGPLELLADIDWDRLEYLSSVDAVFAGGQRRDIMRRGGGGIGVSLGRGVRMTATVERTERHSNSDPRQNFKATRVLSSITIGS